MDISDFYMSRCLELAAHGRGSVAPNPMVGAVLVADVGSLNAGSCRCSGAHSSEGVIIGEGFHRCFGEAHAEANAIASVKDEALLRQATLYVNLEPCSHYGKNPSCAELIIRKAIPRVVAGCLDPNPKVAGRGIKMLREAGVDVTTGVRERESTVLNRFFMTAHQRHRPYIILKWAQSEDGFLDRKRKDASEKPVVFSNAITRRMAHQLRSEVQAIMVGTNTAVLDNPELTVRYWTGTSPVRIVVDRTLRVPQGYRLYDGRYPTIIFTENSHWEEKGERCFANKENMRYHFLEGTGSGLSEIAAFLYENEIQSLLVEGGAQLHRSFLEENLWDEIIVETAPVQLKDGVQSALSYVGEHIQLAERQYIYPRISGDEKPSVIARFINYTF